MTAREKTNRWIIIGVFALIGVVLAKAITNKSFIGIVLALVSLVAYIHFLTILVRAKKELEAEEAREQV